SLCTCANVTCRLALELRMLPHLGGNQQVGWLSARDPFADDRFTLTAGMVWNPGAVDIGGIDKVAAARHKCIENLERCGFVGCPAEDISTKIQWKDIQVTRANFHQNVSPISSCHLNPANIATYWLR